MSNVAKSSTKTLALFRRQTDPLFNKGDVHVRKPFHRKSQTATTAVERSGIQGDLSAVLDKERVKNEDPRVEKPAILIRSLRYLGASEGDTPAAAMTAKSHALYELLMASARIELNKTSEHRVSFADAKAYLDVDRSDRIRGYVNAISSTFVAYDFLERDGYQRIGRIPLLLCEEIVSPSGERFIGFEMHQSIRKIILESREYTHLEIAAFARFKCKYTSRLYPRLALMSGMPVQHPVRFTPEELAAFVGYSVGAKLHYGRFEKDVIDPVLNDLSYGVRRFYVEYTVERAASRGRPVTAVIFTVSKTQKRLDEIKRDNVVPIARARVQKTINDSTADPTTEVPHENILAAAAVQMKWPLNEVATRWLDALERAKADPQAVLGSMCSMTGSELLRIMHEFGVGTAFNEWLQDPFAPDGKFYRRLDGPGCINADDVQDEDRVEIPDTKTESRTDSGYSGYDIIPDFINNSPIKFKDASVIHVVFQDDFIPFYMKTDVLPYISENKSIFHNYDLGVPKILRIEYLNEYVWKIIDIKITTHEMLIPRLYQKYSPYIRTFEYLA
jgi:hypothetical protein